MKYYADMAGAGADGDGFGVEHWKDEGEQRVAVERAMGARRTLDEVLDILEEWGLVTDEAKLLRI